MDESEIERWWDDQVGARLVVRRGLDIGGVRRETKREGGSERGREDSSKRVGREESGKRRRTGENRATGDIEIGLGRVPPAPFTPVM